MPRVIKPEDYQQKRGEILDAAQRFIYTKGYENMTIQDILDALNISKGAFYHYFDSKPALLEALVQRMMDDVSAILAPIIDDPALPALEKLEKFMDTAASWKAAQKAYLMQILRIWYADHNALVRQKLTTAGRVWITPYLVKIFEQGRREGSMLLAAERIQETAQVAVMMLTQMGEAIAMPMLELYAQPDPRQRLAGLESLFSLVIAYRSAIERVVGAPPGSVKLFDLDILREWVQPETTPETYA